jgi:glutamate transport system substrate-binding protein
MAKLQKAGAMTVAVKYDVPGFGLLGLSATPDGFDIRITQLIAAKLGIAPSHITYVQGVATLREEMLERNEVNMVVATYTITPERAKVVTFAGPYYADGQGLMVAANDSAITSVKSLKSNPNAKVCTNSGSSTAVGIQKYLANPGQLVLFDVVSKCVEALGTGQVQAVTDDNSNLIGNVAQSDGKFKLAGGIFTNEPFGIGVHKGDVAFCKFIDATLTQASKDGDYQKAWAATAGKIPGSSTPKLPPLTKCS